MSTNDCDSCRPSSIPQANLNPSASSSTNPRRSSENKLVADKTYEAAIRDLNSLQSNSQVVALAKYKRPQTILPLFKKQLSLAGIKLDDLNRLNIIHVSGTKGKGSTCAFLESILSNSRELRLKVGCYNSPHLVNVTERIKINSKSIDKTLFSKHFRHVFDKLQRGIEREGLTMPSYFSFLTILAFHIFLEEGIDCAIVEVGIGGEYDPTNVVEKPIACVITTLDLDHTNILGTTIEQIAWTKAGIIKPGVPIFTIQHEQDQALALIVQRAREKKAPVYICKPLDQRSNINLGIKSSAQYINASIACQVASYLLHKFNGRHDEQFKINDSNEPVVLEAKLQELPEYFCDSLETCHLPGRCQIIKCPGVTFFVDGAHTYKSMENCIEWFRQASTKLCRDAERYLLVNVIGDRDKAKVLKPLTRFESFEAVIFSTNKIRSDIEDSTTSETFVKNLDLHQNKGLANARTNAEVWKRLFGDETARESPKTFVHSSTVDSLKFLQNNIPMDSHDGGTREVHVLVTGSLHFVGAMLETIELVLSL